MSLRRGASTGACGAARRRGPAKARVVVRGTSRRRAGACGAKAGAALTLATNFRQRALGLFAADIDDKEKRELLICPCHDIHTFGMSRDIDVAFLNRKSEVVHVETGVGKNRIIVRSGASAVVERLHSDAPWFEIGDRVGLSVLEVRR
jgi:uncharacterized membrane protein (UPF0127 family)